MGLVLGWVISQEECRGLGRWFQGSEEGLGVEFDFFRLGICIKVGVRFGDTAWLWCFEWEFVCRLRKVEVDGSGMLSCSVVSFALGLYVVIVWCGSLVFSGGQEQHFLVGL